MFAEIKQRAVYWTSCFVEWHQRRMKNEIDNLFGKKQGNDVLWKTALPRPRVTQKTHRNDRWTQAMDEYLFGKAIRRV